MLFYFKIIIDWVIPQSTVIFLEEEANGLIKLVSFSTTTLLKKCSYLMYELKFQSRILLQINRFEPQRISRIYRGGRTHGYTVLFSPSYIKLNIIEILKVNIMVGSHQFIIQNL